MDRARERGREGGNTELFIGQHVAAEIGLDRSDFEKAERKEDEGEGCGRFVGRFVLLFNFPKFFDNFLRLSNCHLQRGSAFELCQILVSSTQAQARFDIVLNSIYPFF